MAEFGIDQHAENDRFLCPTARQTIALQFTAAILVYVDVMVMVMVYGFI